MWFSCSGALNARALVREKYVLQIQPNLLGHAAAKWAQENSREFRASRTSASCGARAYVTEGGLVNSNINGSFRDVKAQRVNEKLTEGQKVQRR